MSRFLTICFLFFLATISLAQTQKNFKPNVKPVLKVNRIQSSIVIDGNLDDSGWVNAAIASNFTETWPGDQVKPPVETEVILTYDD